jgi:hypothetical protein
VTAGSHARVRREDEIREHAPEPWAQLGKFIRDANGRIVIRGKSPADIRRIVACVNALTGVPTETIETWCIQVAGGAGAGPDPTLPSIPGEAIEAIQEFIGSEDRRLGQRRRGERRRPATQISVEGGDG